MKQKVGCRDEGSEGVGRSGGSKKKMASVSRTQAQPRNASQRDLGAGVEERLERLEAAVREGNRWLEIIARAVMKSEEKEEESEDDESGDE